MRIPTALIGSHVDRTTFDYQVRLNFSAFDANARYRVRAELVIETPFLLRHRDGEWHQLDPGTGSKLAPLLDLFNHTVTAVQIRGNGTLHLTFDDATELRIDPDQRYESWNLTGTGVEEIIVGPSGENDWHLP